jgi:hypothetical protein
MSCSHDGVVGVSRFYHFYRFSTTAHPCLLPTVKPTAGRRATSDFSCDLIDKQAEGPLGMRVDC